MKHMVIFLRYMYRLKNLFAIKWIILPIFFVSLWLFFSLFFSSDASFTVLQTSHVESNQNHFFNRRLLKGQIVSGTFTAKENYLGIVSVKFTKTRTVEYLDEDILIFRLKEQGNSSWIYENTYRSGLAKADEYIPFGFVPLVDSKNKTYIFELESLRGNDTNALILGGDNPIYVTKYQFPKNEIFNNPRSILDFFVKKTFTLLSNFDLVLSSLLYLLPFIFYITWISLGNTYVLYFLKKLHKNKKYKLWTQRISNQIYRSDIDGIHNHAMGIVYIPFIIMLMIWYIAFVTESISAITIGLAGLWVIAIYKLDLNSTLSYVLAFLLVMLSVLSIYGNWMLSVDSSSSLSYFLMIIGIIQDILETRSINNNIKNSGS